MLGVQKWRLLLFLCSLGTQFALSDYLLRLFLLDIQVTLYLINYLRPGKNVLLVEQFAEKSSDWILRLLCIKFLIFRPQHNLLVVSVILFIVKSCFAWFIRRHQIGDFGLVFDLILGDSQVGSLEISGEIAVLNLDRLQLRIKLLSLHFWVQQCPTQEICIFTLSSTLFFCLLGNLFLLIRLSFEVHSFFFKPLHFICQWFDSLMPSHLKLFVFHFGLDRLQAAIHHVHMVLIRD